MTHTYIIAEMSANHCGDKKIAKVNGVKVGLDYSENFMLIRSIL